MKSKERKSFYESFLNKQLQWSNQLASSVIKNPKICISIALLTSIFLISGVFFLKHDFTHSVWFRSGDPYLQQYEDFKKQFGSEETLFLAVHFPQGVFRKENIEIIRELTDKLYYVQDVMRADSITNYHWAYGKGDEIIIDPFIPDNPGQLTESFLAIQSKNAADDKRIESFLISADQRTAVVYGILKPVFEGDRDHRKIVDELDRLVSDFESRHRIKIYTTGWTPITVATQDLTFDDLSLILPTLLLIISIVLFILFRSFVGVILPLLIIFLSSAVAIGFAGWVGIKLDIMTAMIPNILLAVCVADSVHLLTGFRINRQQGLDPRNSVLQTLIKNLRPTALTTISTAIGFLSLTSTDLAPIIHLGLLAAVGTLVAWFLSVFLLMPSLLFLNLKVSQKPEGVSGALGDLSSRFTEQVISRHRFKIIFTFLALSLLFLNFTREAKVNASTFDYLADDLPVKQATNFVQKEVGGVKSLELVIDSDRPEGVKDPQFLHQVESLVTWIEEKTFVTKVLSVLDIVKQVNQALHGNDKAQYTIPENSNMVASNLFLYSMSLPANMGLRNWVTPDYRQLRLRINWITPGSHFTMQQIRDILKKSKEMNLNIAVTGKTSLVVGLNEYIVHSFFTSMAWALLFISLFMAFVFGSLKLGVISMLPNIIPPIFGFGLMSILDLDINVGSILIISTCLGITVDDTIYFLNSYSEENKKGLPAIEVVKNIYRHTGKALIFTTVVLFFSFICFGLGSFKPNVHFGLMTAFVMLVALATDLVLLPALLISASPSHYTHRSKSGHKNRIDKP